MRLYKKADEMVPAIAVFYIPLIIMALILFFISYEFIVSTKSNIAIIPPQFEENIFIHRFLYSPECFIYFDKETGRSSPFIFEDIKFAKSNIEYCYLSEKANKEFKLTLANTETGEKQEIQTKAFVGSAGSAESRDVKIIKESKVYNGKVSIEKNSAQ